MPDETNLIRPKFFTGQLLTAEDLTLEQDYVREKLARHNRTLHGFGIVTGMKVSTSKGKIVIGPGLALDCRGNEIVIAQTEQQPMPPASMNSAYVNVSYSEVNNAATVTEGVKISVAENNCNRNHRHARGRWLSCGLDHELTIAKLRRENAAWRVDRRYRPPVVK